MSTSHMRKANVDHKALLDSHFKPKAVFKLAKRPLRLYEITMVQSVAKNPTKKQEVSENSIRTACVRMVV